MMNKNKLILIIILSLNTYIINIFGMSIVRGEPKKLTTLDKIELAVTTSQKTQGLMYRDKLCASCAMLFVFNKPTKTVFWMKNTYIALDIIFLDNAGKIITIHNNAIPNNTKNRYAASEQYMYVLETNAGFAKQNNLEESDNLNLDYLLSKGVSYGG